MESFSDDPPMDLAGGHQPPNHGPEISPYANPPVELKTSHMNCIIPQSLLQNPEWIEASKSKSAIYLHDVDRNTCHVIVHYLYTGTYQTLANKETSPLKRAQIELRRAILSYSRASAYHLDGLQQLSIHKIKEYGETLGICDLIDAVNIRLYLPRNDDFIFSYLKRRLESAFEEDHTLFAGNGFFSRIKDVVLMSMMSETLAGLYKNKVSRMLGERLVEAHPSGDTRPTPVVEETLWQTEEQWKIEECACVVEDIPPPCEVPVPERKHETKVDDDLDGWWTTTIRKKKTYKKGKEPKRTLPEAESVTILEEQKDDPWEDWSTKKKKKGRKVSDPWSEPELVSPELKIEQAGEAMERRDDISDPWGAFMVKKKKTKKNKGKKKDEPEPEPAPYAPWPVRETEEKPEDLWREWVAGSSKKKKGKKGKAEASSCTEEPEVTSPEEKSDIWDLLESWTIKKKEFERKGYGKKDLLLEIFGPPADESVAEAPLPQPATTAEHDDEWPRSEPSSSTKNPKRPWTYAAVFPPSPPPPDGPEFEPGDMKHEDSGSKKKNKTCKVAWEPDEPDEPGAHCDLMDEVSNKRHLLYSNLKEDRRMEANDATECLNFQHFFQGGKDAWRSCNKCRDFVSLLK